MVHTRNMRRKLGDIRKWEDIDGDCLAKIFAGAGMETLLMSVPLVCKNWHTASLNPHCWKVLNFKSVADTYMSLSFELVKFAVDRSQGLATGVAVGYSLTFQQDFVDIMTYISDGCPMLKILVLHYMLDPKKSECLSKLIKKWKYLEHLSVACADHFHDILTEISIHCKNFASLKPCSYFTFEVATKIVTLLPKIKFLRLRGSDLDLGGLILILSECKELEYLDVSRCVGFDADDAEISMKSKHIKTFLAEGSFQEDWASDYGTGDADFSDGFFSGCS